MRASSVAIHSRAAPMPRVVDVASDSVCRVPNEASLLTSFFRRSSRTAAVIAPVRVASGRRGDGPVRAAQEMMTSGTKAKIQRLMIQSLAGNHRPSTAPGPWSTADSSHLRAPIRHGGKGGRHEVRTAGVSRNHAAAGDGSLEGAARGATEADIRRLRRAEQDAGHGAGAAAG